MSFCLEETPDAQTRDEEIERLVEEEVKVEVSSESQIGGAHSHPHPDREQRN